MEEKKSGRPPIKDKEGVPKYNTKGMCEKIDEYIETRKKALPILKECCLLNDWDYDYVMKLQRKKPLLKQSIKKLLDWKEVRLEQGALTRQLDPSFARFILKQPAHGWVEKTTEEPEVIESDGFKEALNKSARNDWEDYEENS